MIDDSSIETPLSTVDVIGLRFSSETDQLEVLLVKRKHDPFAGHWALPGGFVEMEETIRTAAKRELNEETDVSVKDKAFRQFRAFGGPDRDPRGPVVTVCYFGFLKPNQGEATAATDAAEAAWHPMLDPPTLAFDHGTILNKALQALQERFLHTGVAFHLLPDPFPINRARELYEHVLERSFDPERFQERFLEKKWITPRDQGKKEDRRSPWVSFNEERFSSCRSDHLPFSFEATP